MRSKTIRMLAAALCALILLCSCVTNNNKPSGETSAATGTASDTAAQSEAVSMYDLRRAMCAADPSLPEMLYASSADSNPANLFANISDVDYDKVECFFLAYDAEGKANEIAVVCAKDAGDTQEIKSSLLKHVAERVEMYSTYMPDQEKKAKEAYVFTSGRYAVLIMCDDKDAVKSAFTEYIEK